MMYAEWNGTSWVVDLIDRGASGISDTDSPIGDAGEYSSLVFDNNGVPNIMYGDGQISQSLKWAIRHDPGWDIGGTGGPGEPRNSGFSPSAVVDPTNQLEVAYTDTRYYGNLMLAEYNNGAWTTASLDNGGYKTASTGYDPSIALDSHGFPHISYYNASGPGLRYASWNGTVWTFETVDAMGNAGRYSSLAIDAHDIPHISYYDGSSGELKYATRLTAAGDWVIRTVDTDGDVGRHSSLSLDPSGHPDIAYYDATNHALKFAQWIG
jgi:hypothetical protein